MMTGKEEEETDNGGERRRGKIIRMLREKMQHPSTLGKEET